MSPRRWPAHPQPRPDESLTSWLVRVARANASKLSTWLAAEEGRFVPRTNFDTLASPDLWSLLAERGAVVGGADAVHELTLVDDIARMGDHVAARWLLAVEGRVARPKHRWCPRCLAEDAVPYFRRAWRLEWVRWCPTHGTPLLDACPSCGEHLDFRRTSWATPLTRCWRCDSELTRERADSTPASSFVREAVDEALAAMRAGDAGLGETWSSVWCLQKWCERLGPRRWGDLAAPLWEGAAPVEGIADDASSAAAYAFALAWRFATTARASLPPLVRRFQPAFNRATNYRCPAALLPLRTLLTKRRRLTAVDVETVVERLLTAKQPVHCAAVARLLGVDPHRVTDRPELRAVVENAEKRERGAWVDAMRVRLAQSRDRLTASGARLSRTSLAADAGVSLEVLARWEAETGETFAVSPCETYESLVRGAVEAVRQRGERVSTVVVARELGRERSFIERRPELKAILRATNGDRLPVRQSHGANQ